MSYLHNIAFDRNSDMRYKTGREDRLNHQCTLGSLINKLSKLKPDVKITGFNNPHSYRGYYCELAFELSGKEITVGEALNLCKECMGKVFQGWKGGEYTMGENTPVWFSLEGSSSNNNMIIDLNLQTIPITFTTKVHEI